MSSRLAYPRARAADVFDTYHGVTVGDPYRWLEDPDSVETATWVEAENALTARMLDGALRQSLVRRLTELHDYPRTGVPLKRRDRYFWLHNAGLQNQPVLYVQQGFSSTPRVLLDPNALSPDGTVALTALSPDDDGALVAYGLSTSGSDRQEIRIRDARTGRDLPDLILWTKFVSLAWLPDGSGFYYTRFPKPGTVPEGDENYFCSVWLHRIGDEQDRDTVVLETPEQPDTVFEVATAHGNRWTVITALKGATDRSEVYLIDRDAATSAPLKVFAGFDSSFSFLDAAGERLFFQTDQEAPRGRIVAIDPLRPSEPLREIVPEQADKLSLAIVSGDRMAAAYLHHASDRLQVFDLNGTALTDIVLPVLGSITGIEGRPEDPELLIGFTSFTTPPTNYRCDIRQPELTQFVPDLPGVGSTVNPLSDYQTTQVWYPSKDGTRVSMFLVHQKDLRDGAHPVLLTGYGGFNISLTPSYDPANFVLLERGGIYAVANLRGGGEYGEAWHEAGMLDRKQNVFDDFIAAAEWLVESGFTQPKNMAIEGGSNGGLLTAAVMQQRPDLFGAVVCRVPVADMLRYHLFTIGKFWIPEYGSADDPEQFAYLYRYSPYHNVRDDVAYPPILITTADTDDRVSPGMAKKLAARLQAAAGNPAPVLIRVETKAGHGAGKPVSKVIDEDADIFTFVLTCLGLGTGFPSAKRTDR
jgi:prolyl oligopeptidase